MSTVVERRWGVVFYAFAVALAVIAWTTGPPTFRTWGPWVVGPYALGLVLAAAAVAGRGPGDRWWRWPPLVLASLASMAALANLAGRRVTGEWATGQVEVQVIEQMGRALLTTGTPYIDVGTLGRPPALVDYSPYSPLLAVPGLPSAIVGPHAATDPRWYCAAIFAGTAAAALWHLRAGWPAVALVAGPVTLLQAVSSGTDVVALGLTLLGLTLVVGIPCDGESDRRRALAGGVVLALGTATKLTAAPVLVVALVFAHWRLGTRATRRIAGAALVTTAVIHVPLLLAGPRAFVDNVVLFPAGLTEVVSVAADPFPGYLLASLGPVGRAAAVVLLLVVALAVLVVLFRRPPRTPAEAFLAAAATLTSAILVLPASRFGYFVHPLAFVGAALAAAAAPGRPGRSTITRGRTTEEAIGSTMAAVPRPRARRKQDRSARDR